MELCTPCQSWPNDWELCGLCRFLDPAGAEEALVLVDADLINGPFSYQSIEILFCLPGINIIAFAWVFNNYAAHVVITVGEAQIFELLVSLLRHLLKLAAYVSFDSMFLQLFELVVFLFVEEASKAFTFVAYRSSNGAAGA